MRRIVFVIVSPFFIVRARLACEAQATRPRSALLDSYIIIGPAVRGGLNNLKEQKIDTFVL